MQPASATKSRIHPCEPVSVITVDAVGVDPLQDLHTVAAPLGDVDGRDARIQPPRGPACRKSYGLRAGGVPA
nr:hypothetical protein GCM10010200_059250 [Actinomadura rugatobispora]